MPEPQLLPALPAAPNCGLDCEVAAARIVADSNYAIAKAVEGATDRFGPAADAVAHLGDAQKRLCSFLVRHRVKLLASVPLVLTTVNAISPTAAKALHDALVGFAGS